MKNIEVDLKFYAVRSKDGKWLRTKGYSGSGDSWVDDIKKAKIYPRIGPARSQVTWWSNNYPDYGIPELIELHCTNGIILEEKERVQKAIEKKKQDIINAEISHREWEIEQAQNQLKKAQKKLKELKK
jgi:hypothetical protein